MSINGIVYSCLLCLVSCIARQNLQTSSPKQWSFADNVTAPHDCFPIININNDTFQFNVSIFNRFGSLMFNTSDINKKWICNRNKNEAFISGTYFYTIEYKSLYPQLNLPKSERGTLLIFNKQ